jgi:hypothetical protein
VQEQGWRWEQVQTSDPEREQEPEQASDPEREQESEQERERVPGLPRERATVPVILRLPDGSSAPPWRSAQRPRRHRQERPERGMWSPQGRQRSGRAERSRPPGQARSSCPAIRSWRRPARRGSGWSTTGRGRRVARERRPRARPTVIPSLGPARRNQQPRRSSRPIGPDARGAASGESDRESSSWLGLPRSRHQRRRPSR